MSWIIVNLIGIRVLNTIFLTCLITGLLLLVFVMFTSFHDHHGDYIKDYDHPSITTDIHSAHHILDHTLDHDNHIPTNLELMRLAVQSNETTETHEIQSRFLLGNLSIFLLFFGQIGWFNLEARGDFSILMGIVGGYFASYAFSWFISNYAKTVVVPIQGIVRGDIGIVIYDLDYHISGLVHVKRKDGVVSRVIAKGAFPFDSFRAGDQGYIWTGKDGIYTLTRGKFAENENRKQQDMHEKWTSI